MNINLPEISLATFHWWRLFPLLFFSILGISLNFRKRKNAIACLASVFARRTIITGYFPAKQLVKVLLFVLGSLFLFLVLLRPQWGKIEEHIEQEGRELLIALDVSRSMLAQDLKPNRLYFAKKKIRSLLQQLQCERVGLILFSGEPIVQCPLTSDYAVFNLFLDAIDAQTISNGTTALDKALAKSVKIFEAMPNRKTKLLVVFTDGEDFSSNLAEIKKKAAEIGLHIFTIGVGTAQGAPVPTVDHTGHITGHQKDAKDTVVISQLNEGILKNLAQDSGGVYVTATETEHDIIQLAEQVTRYEKEKFETERMSGLQERYPLFAAASFVCFLLEWLL